MLLNLRTFLGGTPCPGAVFFDLPVIHRRQDAGSICRYRSVCCSTACFFNLLIRFTICTACAAGPGNIAVPLNTGMATTSIVQMIRITTTSSMRVNPYVLPDLFKFPAVDIFVLFFPARSAVSTIADNIIISVYTWRKI